jgi:hypothetical protein
MKKIIVVLFMLAGLWVGCNVDSSQTIRYRVNEPVFSSSETFRRSGRITSEARPLNACDNICFYDNYLYIADPNKGVHIIDNTHPEHPQAKGYIEIPGCQDLIVRDRQLYAAALVDLVWFDLSDPARPLLQGRAENLFPEALPATNNEYGYDYDRCRQGIAQGKIVTGWQLKERRQQSARNGAYSDSDYSLSPVISQSNLINGAASFGSHFSLHDRYLYAIVNNYIHIVDLSADRPEKVGENVHVGSVETVLSYRDRLFLGTPSGLLIYSVEDPQHPVSCSQISHVYGCNPIAVDNDVAYITIRSGNPCGQNTNELLLFDVGNPKQPLKLTSYPMKNPCGLNLRNGRLFLCEEGLKIFQIEAPDKLSAVPLGHYRETRAYNVIPFDDTLFLMADDGLYQYVYSGGEIRWISTLPIKK